MLEFIISPFLLGLSVGIYCFSYCIPFAGPLVISEQREKKENVFLVFQFLLGRLLGYILFGAFFGYLGQRINVLEVNIIINLGLIFLALLLIINALGLIKWKHSSVCSRHKKRIPLLMGFLMGINVCPPFLMSVAYVFTFHNWALGVIYFLMFFLATSVYFLPLLFLGYLSKLKRFQLVGRASSLIVGFLFFSYGIYYIIKIL